MTSSVFSNGRPMTESEFLALGETSQRIELFDGSLHVTPASSLLHQRISRRLANTLDEGADAAGMAVHEAINVRLRPDRIPIPDVVITAAVDFTELVVDASVVRLVCEIASPSNGTTDRVLKKHFYAVAGIPWYLVVEQDTGTLTLYRLDGDEYQEHSVTEVGETLHLSEPVVATIKPAELLPPQ
jgi:Uma2 family endonuclease